MTERNSNSNMPVYQLLWVPVPYRRSMTRVMFIIIPLLSLGLIAEEEMTGADPSPIWTPIDIPDAQRLPMQRYRQLSHFWTPYIRRHPQYEYCTAAVAALERAYPERWPAQYAADKESGDHKALVQLLEDYGKSLPPSETTPRTALAALALHLDEPDLAQQWAASVLKREPKNLPALEVTGWLYEYASEYDEAQQTFEEIRRIAKAKNNPSYLAAAYRYLGHVADEQDDSETSKGHYEKALALERENQNRPMIAVCLRYLAYLDWENDRPAALEKLKEAYSLLLESGDLLGLSSIGNDMGDLLQHMERFEDSLRAYEFSVETATALQWHRSAVYPAIEIGSVLHELGDYAKAKAAFARSLLMATEVDNRNAIAKIHLRIGNTYASQQRENEAERYYLKALAAYEKQNSNSGLAAVVGNLGMIHADRENWEEAKKYQLTAMALYTEMGDRDNLSICCASLGNLYRRLNDPEKAAEYYLKGLRLSEELGDQTGLAVAYGNLGRLYQDELRFDTAKAYYAKALVINKKLGLKDGMAYNYIRLAKLYARDKDHGRARSYGEKALALYEEMEVEEIADHLRRWLKRLEP